MRNTIDFADVIEDTKLAAIKYRMASDDPVVASHCIILVDTQRELG